MVHARVVRPPSPGAQLKSLNTDAASKLPGVLKIVRDGNFLAVVAGREWEAVQALRALRAGCTWSEPAKLPKDIYATLAALPTQDIVIARKDFELGGKAIEASYRRPYQMHGAIGPACAVARYDSEGLTIWSHTRSRSGNITPTSSSSSKPSTTSRAASRRRGWPGATSSRTTRITWAPTSA